MHIRRVRNEADSMRRFVEELWLPYQRDLETSVDSHVMAEDVDVDEIVEFLADHLDDPTKRLWVALDDVDDPTGPIADLDATFAGFLTTSLRTPPSKYATPDRLSLGNTYLDPAYRGTGLADAWLPARFSTRTRTVLQNSPSKWPSTTTARSPTTRNWASTLLDTGCASHSKRYSSIRNVVSIEPPQISLMLSARPLSSTTLLKFSESRMDASLNQKLCSSLHVQATNYSSRRSTARRVTSHSSG